MVHARSRTSKNGAQLSRRPRKLIASPPRWLRERRRGDGSVRIWWEPSQAARDAGFDPVDFDERKLTHAVRQADQLNARVDRALAGQDRPPARSIAALAAAYKSDPDFLGKKPATQTDYLKRLRVICARWGSAKAASIDKPAMRAWYVQIRDTSGVTQADRVLAVMSILMSHAELIGWRAENSNPCFRLKRTATPPRSRHASFEEIRALLDAADRLGLSSMADACLLSLLQGQRQTDIINARISDFTVSRVGDLPRWTWKLRRSKRGTLGAMCLHPVVLDRIRARIEAGSPETCIVLSEATGAPYSGDSFRRSFAAVRSSAAGEAPSLCAGGDVLQFRDLRRTFALLARRGGAHDDDIADVLGNSADRDALLEETYMPASLETASRAVLAIDWPLAA